MAAQEAQITDRGELDSATSWGDAALPFLMADHHLRQPENRGPLLRQAQAQIHVFVIQGETGIKTRGRLMSCGLQHQTAAAEPIQPQWFMPQRISRADFAAAEIQAWIKPAGTGFDLPCCILNSSSHNSLT